MLLGIRPRRGYQGELHTSLVFDWLYTQVRIDRISNNYCWQEIGVGIFHILAVLNSLFVLTVLLSLFWNMHAANGTHPKSFETEHVPLTTITWSHRLATNMLSLALCSLPVFKQYSFIMNRYFTEYWLQQHPITIHKHYSTLLEPGCIPSQLRFFCCRDISCDPQSSLAWPTILAACRKKYLVSAFFFFVQF